MKYAVDAYSTRSGAHKRHEVEAKSGDEAASVVSKMLPPGFVIRAIVPAPDAGQPELRLPAAFAATYAGDPAIVEIAHREDLAGTGNSGGPGAAVDAGIVDHTPAEAVQPVSAPDTPAPFKRGRGRPRKHPIPPGVETKP